MIEKGILPLCNTLNAIEGVSTQYSCEGHPRYGLEPYVMFFSSIEVARKIAIFLDQAQENHHSKFVWMIEGNFEHKTQSLRWVIRPNDIRLGKVSFRNKWFSRMLKRETDADINKISSLIRKLFE